MEVRGKYVIKKSLSARINEDTYGAIEAYCKEHGLSQALFVERLVKSFFAGGQVLADPVDEKIAAAIAPIRDDIEAAIAPLRDELEELRTRLGKQRVA